MTDWLIDKSALVRPADSPDAAEWANRIERGLVRISTVTRLEVGFSARSGAAARAAGATPPLSAMPVEYLTPTIEDRAVQAQLSLADQGRHRAPSIPDLLLATTTELASRTVLHLDRDFDLIAALTGQPVERLTVGKLRRRSRLTGRQRAPPPERRPVPRRRRHEHGAVNTSRRCMVMQPDIQRRVSATSRRRSRSVDSAHRHVEEGRADRKVCTGGSTPGLDRPGYFGAPLLAV